jgi:acyl-CoA dehydrogenase
MTNFDSLRSPLTFIEDLTDRETAAILKDYESWWLAEGISISEAVDRAGTPWLRMFDQSGRRVDEILLPPDYWRMLKRGYETGAIWRAVSEPRSSGRATSVDQDSSLKMHYLIDYVTCFFDAGLGCPYIVSLSTTVPLKKYGSPELQERFLPHLLRRDGTNWQGATWMTEVKGGSDLGANVETIARRTNESVPGAFFPLPLGEGKGEGPGHVGIATGLSGPDNRWLLTGDKYFGSNVGAELAIVAARPEGAAPGPRGLALFLVPRYRSTLPGVAVTDSSRGQVRSTPPPEPGNLMIPEPALAGDRRLNYFIRRLKNKIGTRSVPTGEVEFRDSEAYLLGKPEWGIYLILESLNLSRVGNIVGSVALAQRALADALAFAETRVAFGKPIIEHPLMRRQFEERFAQLRDARALMWEAIKLLDDVWHETPRDAATNSSGYSDRYHLFRLVTHLAKYWTAELAVQFAKWNMEVHGGLGVLAEYAAERWLREAMILPIWEGTPHRQMLDGLEVMERKRAHELLLANLAPAADKDELEEISSRLERHLQLSPTEREAGIEPLFRDLAAFTARTLSQYQLR